MGRAVAERCDVAEDADVAALIASAVGQFGRLDIMFNNVGIPTPRLGMAFEDHSVEDFERLTAVNFRGVFLGCRARRDPVQGAGRGRSDPEHGIGRRSRGLGRNGLRGHEGRGAPADPGRGGRGGALRHPGERDLPGRHALYRLHGGGRDDRLGRRPGGCGGAHRLDAPLGRPITAEDCAAAAVYLCSDQAANVTGILLPIDGGYVAQ